MHNSVGPLVARNDLGAFTIRQLAVAWRLSPFQITLDGTFTGIAQVRRVATHVVLSASGLTALAAPGSGALPNRSFPQQTPFRRGASLWRVS